MTRMATLEPRLATVGSHQVYRFAVHALPGKVLHCVDGGGMGATIYNTALGGGFGLSYCLMQVNYEVKRRRSHVKVGRRSCTRPVARTMPSTMRWSTTR